MLSIENFGFVWTATGSINLEDLLKESLVEATIPLKRWWPLPPIHLDSPGIEIPPAALGVLLEVKLPNGETKRRILNARDIPEDEFRQFPFPTFVAQGSGVAQFGAASSNYGINPGHSAKIKDYGISPTHLTSHSTLRDTGDDIEAVVRGAGIIVKWLWPFSFELPSRGVTYELAVPLKLDGDSYDGWEKPVTIQLELPNGEVVVRTTVKPKDIPLGGFKHFVLPKFVPPASGELVLLAVTTQQAPGDSPCPLRLGAEKFTTSAA